MTFQVAANATTAARTGSLTIAGKTVNVNQAGTCDVTLAPTGVSAAAAASTGLVGVATGATCTWSATSSAAWLTVTSGGSGPGNGTVGYSMTANTGAARTASLTIGGRQFSVQQAAPACSVSLSPTNTALTPGIASRGITVTAGAGCPWTTTNTASWITITSGASGTGNGSVFVQRRREQYECRAHGNPDHRRTTGHGHTGRSGLRDHALSGVGHGGGHRIECIGDGGRISPAPGRPRAVCRGSALPPVDRVQETGPSSTRSRRIRPRRSAPASSRVAGRTFSVTQAATTARSSAIRRSRATACRFLRRRSTSASA